jgi:hypothetical protein
MTESNSQIQSLSEFESQTTEGAANLATNPAAVLVVRSGVDRVTPLREFESEFRKKRGLLDRPR